MSEQTTKTTSVPSRNILEVAMEMSLTPEILSAVEKRFGLEAAQAAGMSTSVGGIGPLLRERVIAQQEQGAHVVGVSLLYNTVWSQAWHDWNHLILERVQAGRYLREILTDAGFTLDLPLFDGRKISVKVWKAPYGPSVVYFLDCPEITDVVYPCAEDAPANTYDTNAWAEKQRLLHSWLVGRGALAVAKAIGFRPDIVVMSETPTLFGHPKLVNDELASDPLFAESRTIFNDHTPLEYAHPIWPRETLELTRMNPAIYGPFLKDGRIDITQMLVGVSDGAFGVAEKHGRVMRAMPSLHAQAAKILHVTNGVSVDYWQNPLFTRWESMTDTDLIAAKEKLKEVFLEWLWRRALLWPHWAKKMRTHPVALWTRRITSYKRLDILERIFHDPKRRKTFLDSGVVLVVGGRIYQRDNVSEKMVYGLVEFLNRDEELGERVIFLHNYNVWEAPRLFYGADGSVMLSDDGREASATGFMKAQMNGAAVIANPDGAVPEFVFIEGETPKGKQPNGFGVSYSNGQPDPDSFLKALNDFSSAFYDPQRRAAMIRGALAVTPEVSVDRTAREMAAYFESILKK
jgi:glucan phosphorylase